MDKPRLKEAPKGVKDVKSQPAVRVDFPAEGEVAAPGGYTLRISAAPETEDVEVSLDGGDWVCCREALGYWWFDWTDYKPGEHTLVALSRLGNVASLSTTRRFKVE
ncbi:MAG: hypothetical protein HY925_16895 [Elusimicrobia bacterium]|nr:hypothetical protein [Elusimicrobiota bacterium]